MKTARNPVLFFCSLVMAAVLAFNSHPLSAESEKRFKVRLSVSADPEIEPLVRSYLSREFRALGDVDLVEKGEDWALSILCSQVKSAGRNYVWMSIVVSELYPNAAILSLVPAEHKKLGDEITSGLYLANGHVVQSCAEENLQQTCAKFVAEFDTRRIEKERQRWKDVRKMMQQQKN